MRKNLRRLHQKPAAQQQLEATAEGLGRIIATGLRTSQVRFHEFVKEAWPIIEPARQFIDSFHIEAICEHLEALTFGQIRRLIINMPPRYGKSNLVTILWPCWEWTIMPTMRWMFCSYSGGSTGLSTKHSLMRRLVITSDWYQQKWGSAVQIAFGQNLQAQFENTRRGSMVATSTGGTVTGKGGDVLVGDDMLNPEQAESEAERKRTIHFLDYTWLKRLDDKKRGRVVFVEQRTHPQDVTAHLLKLGGFEHLVMPAEFTEQRTYILPMSKRKIIKEIGDVLAPEREGHEELEQVKRSGLRAYNSQYLQKPSDEEGGLFKRSQFRPMAERPTPEFTIDVWDTAETGHQQAKKIKAAFSAGLCIIKHKLGFHFCAMTHEQLRFSQLKLAVHNRYAIDRPDLILVEAKSSGVQVIQELQDNTNIPILGTSQVDFMKDYLKLDKYARARLVEPIFAAGKITYDPAMPNAAELIEEFCTFPDGIFKDIVDAGVHGVYYLSKLDAQGQGHEDDYEEMEGEITDGL